MSNNSMFPTKLLETAHQIMTESDPKAENIKEPAPKIIDDEPALPSDDESIQQDEIFNMDEEIVEAKPDVEISKKTGKPKRKLTEKQLENLANARAKGLIKRRELALVKKKDRELAKLERTKHIRTKRAKQLEEEAQISALAQESVQKTEAAGWNDEKLVSLMNRTMDTYFEKRKAEKTKREFIPVDPATQGYYMPAQPPQAQRYVPKPVAQPVILRSDPSHPEYNPYLKLFGLK